MAPGVDYSKWDRLELSDDEDTFYEGFDRNLNIRVNRMCREDKDTEIDERISRAEEAQDHQMASELQSKRPLHVDNICKVSEDRTIIMPARDSSAYVAKEAAFSAPEFRAFKEKHAELLQEFARADWEESLQLLEKRGDVLLDAHGHAENAFLLEAYDVELREKGEDLLRQYGLQVEVLAQIRHLSVSSSRPARDLVRRYYDKFRSGEAREALEERVSQQLDRIRRQAALRRRPPPQASSDGAGAAAIAVASAAASASPAAATASESGKFDEMRKAPLVEAMYTMTPELRRGPGGLDPVEVFESLPVNLQAAFKEGSMEKLHEAAEEIDEGEFDVHLQRCIDSGLWKC